MKNGCEKSSIGTGTRWDSRQEESSPAGRSGKRVIHLSGAGTLRGFVTILFLFCLFMAFLCTVQTGSVAAFPRVDEPGKDVPVSKNPTLSGTFLTFFVWKNDRDFDSTRPLFDEYGQSVGYVNVTLYPRLTWKPNRSVTFHYFAEVGNAFWSSHEADPFTEVEDSKPVYVQRELWAQILLPWEGYGMRVGFQYIHDPTLLFLEKDVGALHLFYRKEETVLRFSALQVPDTEFEGFDFDENNFQNDNFIFALDGSLSILGGIQIRPGLFFQWDRTDAKRPKYLWNPCVNLSHDFGGAGTWELDAILQAGTWRSRSINNRNMDLLAGALQVHGALTIMGVDMEANLLAFTPDDGDPHNGLDTGFHYSGFSKSRTFVLSQNWIFDQYDNLDEAAAASRAGLFLVDLFASLPLGKHTELFGVLGYGMVLEDRFANRGRSLGTEIDAGVFWYPYPNTRLVGFGGVLVPGRAGGAFRNEIALGATDPLYTFQAAAEMSF